MIPIFQLVIVTCVVIITAVYLVDRFFDLRYKNNLFIFLPSIKEYILNYINGEQGELALLREDVSKQYCLIQNCKIELINLSYAIEQDHVHKIQIPSYINNIINNLEGGEQNNESKN